MKSLHEKAAAAYDEKLENLLTKLLPMPGDAFGEKAPTNPSVGSDSDPYVVKQLVLSDDSVRTMRPSWTDYTGQNCSCSFETSLGFVGLEGEDHALLVNTVRRLAAEAPYRDTLSEQFVYAAAFDWLQSAADRLNLGTFTMHVAEQAKNAVSRFEVWLPLPIVRIEHPFTIGLVTFRTITKEMLDQMATSLRPKVPEEELTHWERWIRPKLQGATAAVVDVEAEPIKGRQVATALCDLSVAAMRLACPAIFNPYQWAPVDSKLIDSLGGSMALTVVGGLITGESEAVEPGMLAHWRLSGRLIHENGRRIWSHMNRLVLSPRNEFQADLIDALVQYSRSVLTANTSERVLYMVSGLERLFVNKGEPAVQTLSDRVALMGGPTKEDRMAKRDVFRRVYDLRSSFVHSAQAVANAKELEEFFLATWSTFIFVLHNQHRWQTKQDFIRTLEEQKFAGPPFNTVRPS